MTSNMSRDEQLACYHADILALLKIDPHHPLAQILGRGMMDVLERLETD